ncbi:MAG TPA: hypothetical protein VHI93_06660, partial [Candidatus Thermoplasmatota archaeon]|nr:hypothetical protein [Candidatus Thermoplasmatota archaeon]
AVKFFVEGPLRRRFFVSVGSEKGIRFHFPPEEDWVDYRDLLLTHYASFCEEFRRLLESEDARPDPPRERPRSWFTFMDQKVSEPDADGTGVTQVGGLVFLPEPQQAKR